VYSSKLYAVLRHQSLPGNGTRYYESNSKGVLDLNITGNIVRRTIEDTLPVLYYRYTVRRKVQQRMTCVYVTLNYNLQIRDVESVTRSESMCNAYCTFVGQKCCISRALSSNDFRV
jgi:hypothetical protein